MVLRKSFLSLHIFWFEKAKIKFLKKIRVLSAYFRIEVQVISNPSCSLEKHQTSDFFSFERFFMIFLKKLISTFSDFFENNQLHILISLYAFYLM